MSKYDPPSDPFGGDRQCRICDEPLEYNTLIREWECTNDHEERNEEMTNYTLLDIRTVTDTDNRPYQVADVGHEGAILPVSVPLYEIHGIDVDRLADLIDTVNAELVVENTTDSRTPAEQHLIDSGAVDANGNLKPYKPSGHKSQPLTPEELEMDYQDQGDSRI